MWVNYLKFTIDFNIYTTVNKSYILKYMHKSHFTCIKTSLHGTEIPIKWNFKLFVQKGRKNEKENRKIT